MKQEAPAAERNRGPIWSALESRLPERGLLLEIASGSGRHAAHFAEARPTLVIQPSEPTPRGRASIEAWRDDLDAPNLRAPLDLDVRRWPWPLENADAIFCCNMIHVAPWVAAEDLFRGAEAVLPTGGLLATYGPYLVGGQPTTESNAAFDASLRQRNPAWGLRDVQDLKQLGERYRLELKEQLDMPASNFMLVFERLA